MKIKIDFFSDWHCGSGLTSGADVDLLCVKDECGLPYIPGKTIKGLLREAAETIYNEDKEFIEKCFGKQSEKKEDVFEKGFCYFSNAELTKNVKEQLKDSSKKELLFRKISSTKIDENGIAEEHSLRKMEVAVPLVLFAEISDLQDEYSPQMEKCLKFIKRLGTNRNRGLGRCNISIYKEEK